MIEPERPAIGIVEALGLDGSVFSNPMEWPNVEAAMRSPEEPEPDAN